MKGNSREKQPAVGQPNRLNRTQQPPQPKMQNLDNTYQVPKKTTIYDKPGSQKAMLPPRAGSSQKINYKIEDNMTNSKIKEAKTGLHLLKKKMVKTGMSREKGDRNGSIEKREEVYRPNQGASKQQDYYGYQKEVKKPTPQMVPKKPSGGDIPKKTPTTSSKTIEERPVKKQPMQQRPVEDQYINPNEEVPLNSNQNFMAILERQMAKQNSKAQPMSKGVAKKAVILDQNQEQIQLAECSKGCGRSFNVKIIEKHEKVCEKVFQSKRKAFNSASSRQPQVQDFKIPPPPPTIKQQKQLKKKGGKQKQKAKQIPKWKLQSAAFRAGLKAGRGTQLSAEQKAAADHANGSVQCPVCSRTFNETAGKRHIAFCESKAKQLPKMNTTKKK